MFMTSELLQLSAIHSAVDVFFNPTLESGCPNVNLEAEACGSPTETYRTGGSSETICGLRSAVAQFLPEALSHISRLVEAK